MSEHQDQGSASANGPSPIDPGADFQSTIRLDVALDDNRIPDRLRWTSSDGKLAEGGDTRAFLLSIWDPERRETLSIDLWTKEMQRDEMDLMVFQTLLTLSDSYTRANGDAAVGEMIKEFGFAFGERVKLIQRQPAEGEAGQASGQSATQPGQQSSTPHGKQAAPPPSDLPAPGTAGAPDAPPPRKQENKP